MIKVTHKSGVKDPVLFGSYPDGSFYTKWRPNEAYGLPTGIEFLGTSLEELHKALYLADALAFRGHTDLVLTIPFIPGGRQDRLNETGDFLWTSRSVADDINARQFAAVVAVDPHSDGCKEINRLVTAPAFTYAHVDRFEGVYDGVIAPDKGARDRASAVGIRLGIPTYAAGKTRDVTTGQLTGFVFPPELVTGRYLVVDDICDGGGTFIGLAKAAPKTVSLDLFVTHGLFTKGPDDLTFFYRNVYTNFLYGPPQRGVQVLGSI